MSSGPFSPEIVEAVARHMNVDHADDSLLIVRALGGQPTATEVRMTGLDEAGLVFSAVVDGGPAEARVPWSAPPSKRAQIRAEVVSMYRRACEALGIEPRQAGEH